jgi:hypothetical protein
MQKIGLEDHVRQALIITFADLLKGAEVINPAGTTRQVLAWVCIGENELPPAAQPSFSSINSWISPLDFPEDPATTSSNSSLSSFTLSP